MRKFSELVAQSVGATGSQGTFQVQVPTSKILLISTDSHLILYKFPLLFYLLVITQIVEVKKVTFKEKKLIIVQVYERVSSHGAQWDVYSASCIILIYFSQLLLSQFPRHKVRDVLPQPMFGLPSQFPVSES